MYKLRFCCRKTRSFKEPLDDKVMETLTYKKFSDETMKKVNWVRRMYNDWRNYRNNSEHLKSIDSDIEDINSLSQEGLCKDVAKFVTEVKKVDGSDYPARTMYDIVICIQFWLESKGVMWRLLSDGVFKDLKYTLDNVMKSRHESGIGHKVRQAEILSLSDEEILWSMGLLGSSNPQVLLNTLVYLLGLHCALRAGKEHRVLRSLPFKSQFEFLVDSAGQYYVKYTEDTGLKTNKGGLKHRKVDVKIVDIYPSPNSDRCPVAILRKYLSLLPPHRVTKALYLQPKKNYTSKVWYLDRPVGVNTLRNTVKDLCDKTDIPGFRTNHSLRSSSTTRMYGGGVPEQVIQEITGHRSLSVRKYKRTNESQRRIASQIISGQ